jgi:hypothetical protein
LPGGAFCRSGGPKAALPQSGPSKSIDPADQIFDVLLKKIKKFVVLLIF